MVEGSRRGRGWERREHALSSLTREESKEQKKNRLSAARGERIQRMRSPNERRGEKTRDVPSLQERVRRINILLRAGAYDRNRFDKMPDTVHGVPKSEIEAWLASLTEYERQRLYVLGRKKIDFKMEKKEYPELSDEEFEREKIFQKEQKELADALEIVAIPMLQAIFKKIGKNADVYLTSANDDIAGGLDVAIDLKKLDGSPYRFRDGSPMRFVVDMTYARMRDKISKDRMRGRISEDAYRILKDKDDDVPAELSNARAMKLFRTVVETLGEKMSTLTFDKKGALKKPQEHVPRLIIGLDWESAFSAIADWVEQGDEFEEKFQQSGLAERIAHSIENQLQGLHALAALDPKNPNAEYLAQLIRTLDFRVDERRLTQDRSLENIDRLLTLDTEDPKQWQRNRLYRAALAQVAHGARRGARMRGDTVEKSARKEDDALTTLKGARERETRPTTPAVPRTEPSLPKAKPREQPAAEMSDEERQEQIAEVARRLELLELRRKVEELLREMDIT